MYNLLVSGDETAWESGVYELERSRVGQYTVQELKNRYSELNQEVVNELLGYPCLFAYEACHHKLARLGWITRIKLKSNSVVIHFTFEPTLPAIESEDINRLKLNLDIDKFEMNRTHWAIKDEDLFEILVQQDLVEQASLDIIHNRNSSNTVNMHTSNSNQIFIVHGHDELAKVEMARFISQLGLEPIILHEQPNAGRTIIEKIEYYSNVGFGVVLYTPCDKGGKATDEVLQNRARQNVVFEHGFLIGKLSRSRVSAFVKGSLETPNDISGVVYTSLDSYGAWKNELAQELRSSGYSIDMNNVL